LQEFYETHKAYDEKMPLAYERLTIKFANSPVMVMGKLAACITVETNAILEGFNLKISIIKRRARGFRNMKNFIFRLWRIVSPPTADYKPCQRRIYRFSELLKSTQGERGRALIFKSEHQAESFAK
jgi:hypothetical protein